MYGVPSTLDLSPFRGRTLIQIALGEWQAQFHFPPKGSINVEGRWQLLDEQAQVLDRSLEPNQRSEYRLHRILGKVVAATQVNPAGLHLPDLRERLRAPRLGR